MPKAQRTESSAVAQLEGMVTEPTDRTRDDARRKRNEGFEHRRRQAISERLRGTVAPGPKYPLMVVSRHDTSLAMNCGVQDLVRTAFWQNVPYEGKVRDGNEVFTQQEGIFRCFSSVLIAIRTNYCNPFGRKVFNVAPEITNALTAQVTVPKIEAEMLSCIGSDSTDGVFALPANLLVAGKIVTIVARDDDYKYSVDGGPLIDLPFSGYPFPSDWAITSIEQAQRHITKLAVRRKDLLTNYDLMDNITSMNRASLVSHLPRENISWSRFELTSDQIFLGTVFGYGIALEDLGLRMLKDQARWTATANRRLLTDRYAEMILRPPSG